MSEFPCGVSGQIRSSPASSQFIFATVLKFTICDYSSPSLLLPAEFRHYQDLSSSSSFLRCVHSSILNMHHHIAFFKVQCFLFFGTSLHTNIQTCIIALHKHVFASFCRKVVRMLDSILLRALTINITTTHPVRTEESSSQGSSIFQSVLKRGPSQKGRRTNFRRMKRKSSSRT